jgi:hypothetical protein
MCSSQCDERLRQPTAGWAGDCATKSEISGWRETAYLVECKGAAPLEITPSTGSLGPKMAAINVIRQQHAIHIISDGVFCDNTGIVCEIGPNAFALPHLPAALAIRGSSHFMPFLVHRLSRECQSFDDMLAKVVRTAREVHLSFPTAFGTIGYGTIEPDFDLVAVGWSKSRGAPAAYLISSHDQVVARGLTAKAWQLIELPDVLIAPPIAEKQITAAGWEVPYSAESFRPDSDGVALLQAQRLSRREVDPRFGMRGYVYVVGGFVQLTSVTSHGVSSDILHWWPDKVGGRIDPHA